MIPAANPMQAGGAPPPSQGGQPLGQGGGAPGGLAGAPAQGSALGGSPVGLGGSTDPTEILAKAQLLLKSGAISPQQYAMILAKLGIGSGAKGATAPPTAPGGMPGNGAPAPQAGGGPSPQWNQ